MPPAAAEQCSLNADWVLRKLTQPPTKVNSRTRYFLRAREVLGCRGVAGPGRAGDAARGRDYSSEEVSGGMTALLAAAALMGPAPLRAGSHPAVRAPVRSHSAVAVALPADLLALAQKMEGLSVTSERFRLRTAISAARGAHVPREVLRFLQVFNIDLAGEAANSSRSFKFTFLGHTFTLRVVGGRTYLYEPSIAKRDGGRPWVNLGRRGLGALLGGGATTPAPGSAGSGSFKKLAGLLRHATSAQELGPGMVDGQAITGFRMTLDESALEEGRPAGPAKPRPITERIGLAAAAQPSRGITLETMIAPSGLPVETRIEIASEGISFGLLDDVYAINFPLSLRAPPKRQTIGLAALRRLGRRHHGTPRGAHEDALHS